MAVQEYGIRNVFVDRETELTKLNDLLKKVRTGVGQIVIINGEHGIGKTRLVEEFKSILENEQDLQIQFLGSRCKRAGGRDPYLPFIEALKYKSKMKTPRIYQDSEFDIESKETEIEEVGSKGKDIFKEFKDSAENVDFIKEPKDEPLTEPKNKITEELAESKVGLEKEDGKWPSSTIVMNQLQDKLTDSGYDLIHVVEIPGVDIVSNNPESIIKRIFFSYMPKFDLKKAMALERSLERFSPDLCVLIGSKDDTDSKLFIVGKNIILSDMDTVLNTDFLINLEEHI